MNLDQKNYVPILKWKRAEQSALRDLTNARKSATMPLVEFVMPKPKGLPSGVDIEVYRNAAISALSDEKIDKFAKEIENIWGKNPIFIDLTYIYPEVEDKVSVRVIDAAHDAGLMITPVLNVSASPKLKNIILKKRNEYKLDIALRVSSVDLDDIDILNKQLATYLALPGSYIDQTSVVIDLKDITDTDIYLHYANIAQNITQLRKWKNFILASGAFPVDLSSYKLEDDNEIARYDWLNWSKHIAENPERLPTFSDYGIRHPIYVESNLLLFPTASLKYTLSDTWKLIKGQKQKYEQYLAAAYLITTDNAVFYGNNFSSGDAYIAEKAKHLEAYQKDNSIKGTGSTESWLNAGFNHHMSVVVDQVSN